MSKWPAAFVDIWPADGGSISLSSGNGAVLSVEVSKDIWNTSSGTFEIVLPPGGPSGPDYTPQWIDIITPMSLVVIGLQRSIPGASRANIVMVGVVTAVEQDIAWHFGSPVQRVCRVTGRDFSYFFDQQSAYCTTILRFAPAGLATLAGALAANGINSGTPDAIALNFYNNIMAGSGGIMSGTKFAYQGGFIPWSEMVSTDIQAYPNVPVSIPLAWNFLAVDGTWTDRFGMILPFPWYEAILATVPGGSIGISDAPYFQPAGPEFIARPLPLPRLTNNGAALDMSLWSALPTVTPDGGAAIIEQSNVFDISEVRNFYILNPSYLNTLQGVSNQQIAPFMYQYAGWIDVPSIQKYGYKPRISNIFWLADPVGNQAQQNAGSEAAYEQMVSDLALVPVGYNEPAALMAKGTAVLNLRPDIAPGVKFLYSPDKSGTQWLAYVRTVNHRFMFGHESITTLGFCRSLPASVYNDAGLLLAIHRGEGARVDGQYIAQYSGIEPFNQTNAQSDLASLSAAYSTPGAQ